ncbi:hypothetical protein SCA6_019546 [Theobroma cacao]
MQNALCQLRFLAPGRGQDDGIQWPTEEVPRTASSAPQQARVRSSRRVTTASFCIGGINDEGLSSLIFRFSPKFVRQLSIKACRNCSNIGVPQIVAASWSNSPASSSPSSAVAAAQATAATTVHISDDVAVVQGCNDNGSVLSGGSDNSTTFFLSSDRTITVHAIDRLGWGIVIVAITTPHSQVMLMALVLAGGHMVTTTNCYQKTRTFIETILPKMGISATVMDRADVDDLEAALNKNKRHEDIASSCTTTEFNNIKDGKVLEAHPWVKRFYHPGLPSHSEHEIAKQQMTGFGGVVSFEVDRDLMTTIKFVDAFKIPNIAPSLGGCESIADQPTIMSYWDLTQAERRKYGIEDNLVRFSFGVEDLKDLKADILQAPRNHIKACIAFLIFVFKIFDCSLQTFWSGLVVLVFQLALISKVSVVFQLGSSLLE